MKNFFKHKLPPFLLLAWFTAGLIGYVAGHKPFGAAQLLVWLQAAWQALTAIIILTLAGGLGEKILPPTPAGMVRAALSAGLGLGLLGFTTLGVGLFLGAGGGFSLGLLLTAALLAGRKSRAWLRNFQTPFSFAPLSWPLCLLLLLLLLPPLLSALAPPLTWDALVYHLALPQLAAHSGRIAYTPDLMYAGMPQLTEMLYLLALSLAGTPAAAFLGLLIGLLALLALSEFSAQQFSPRAGQGTLMALAAGETLMNELGWGYVDWAAFFFGALTLFCLACWLQQQKRKWLLLAGVFIGLTLSVKYTAGVILPAAWLFLWLRRAPGGWREKTVQTFSLGLAAGLVFSPWLLRNLAWTGNPFYPLLFPAGAVTAPRLASFQGLPPWRGWRDVALLPWQATMLGIEDKEGFSASIGPLLLLLSPAALMGWGSRPRFQKELLLLSACLTLTGMVIWLIGSRLSFLLIQTRLYLAFFPAWALLAGAGLESLSALHFPGLRLGKIFNALALLPLVFGALTGIQSFAARGTSGYWLGNLTAEEYRARSLGAWTEAMQAIAALPPGSRVLMLWETRGLDCLPRCDPDETIDRWYEEVHTALQTSEEHRDGYSGYAQNKPEKAFQPRKAADILRDWQLAGYTYILVFENGAQFIRQDSASRLTAQDWQVFDEVLGLLRFEQSIGGGVYSLYAVP